MDRDQNEKDDTLDNKNDDKREVEQRDFTVEAWQGNTTEIAGTKSGSFEALPKGGKEEPSPEIIKEDKEEQQEQPEPIEISKINCPSEELLVPIPVPVEPEVSTPVAKKKKQAFPMIKETKAETAAPTPTTPVKAAPDKNRVARRKSQFVINAHKTSPVQRDMRSYQIYMNSVNAKVEQQRIEMRCGDLRQGSPVEARYASQSKLETSMPEGAEGPPADSHHQGYSLNDKSKFSTDQGLAQSEQCKNEKQSFKSKSSMKSKQNASKGKKTGAVFIQNQLKKKNMESMEKIDKKFMQLKLNQNSLFDIAPVNNEDTKDNSSTGDRTSGGVKATHRGLPPNVQLKNMLDKKPKHVRNSSNQMPLHLPSLQINQQSGSIQDTAAGSGSLVELKPFHHPRHSDSYQSSMVNYNFTFALGDPLKDKFEKDTYVLKKEINDHCTETFAEKCRFTLNIFRNHKRDQVILDHNYQRALRLRKASLNSQRSQHKDKKKESQEIELTQDLTVPTNNGKIVVSVTPAGGMVQQELLPIHEKDNMYKTGTDAEWKKQVNFVEQKQLMEQKPKSGFVNIQDGAQTQPRQIQITSEADSDIFNRKAYSFIARGSIGDDEAISNVPDTQTVRIIEYSPGSNGANSGQQFWKKYEARKKQQEDYNKLADKYAVSNYLDRMEQKTKQMSESKQLSKIATEKRRQLEIGDSYSRQNVTLEDNVFQKKFPGSETVKHYLKRRMSPLGEQSRAMLRVGDSPADKGQYLMTRQPAYRHEPARISTIARRRPSKVKQYQVVANTATQTFQYREQQTESTGFMRHLRSHQQKSPERFRNVRFRGVYPEGDSNVL